MSDNAIGENLQKLLRLHGDLSLSDLSRQTKIPQPTLHHIVDGKTKKPRRQALEAIANFFSITIPQLTGALPLSLIIPESIKDSFKISTVPIIDWEIVKDWDRSKYASEKFDEIILDRKVDLNAFALQLTNNNLEPLFQEHSILIFDPSKLAKERDFALVYLSKQDLLIFNRIFIDSHGTYIKQDKINGDAELIKINPSIDKIIATLIEVRIKY